MKLFVDDLRREPKGWIRTSTITEAIIILATKLVVIVSLDYDIVNSCNHRPSEPFSNETFEPVARYLALMEYRPEIQFHTSNHWGFKHMCDILEVSPKGKLKKYPEDFKNEG